MSDDDHPEDAEGDERTGEAGDGTSPADASGDTGTGHEDTGDEESEDEGVQPGDSVAAHDPDGEGASADASGFGFDEDPEVGDGDEPLSELVERTREADDVDAEAVMDAFESVEVDAVDAEALWEQLEVSPEAGPTAASVTDGVAEAGEEGGRDVQTIAIREYCMRCQYFSAPPEARCEHARGEILELVGTDRFRVADCPIVGGQEELENLRR